MVMKLCAQSVKNFTAGTKQSPQIKTGFYTSLVTPSQCLMTHRVFMREQTVNNNCLIGTFIFSYLFDSSHRSQAQSLLSSCSHSPAVTGFTWRGLLPLVVSPSWHSSFSSQKFVPPLSKAHNKEMVLSDPFKIREGFVLPQSTRSDLGPSDEAPEKQLKAQKRHRCLKSQFQVRPNSTFSPAPQCPTKMVKASQRAFNKKKACSYYSFCNQDLCIVPHATYFSSASSLGGASSESSTTVSFC